MKQKLLIHPVPVGSRKAGDRVRLGDRGSGPGWLAVVTGGARFARHGSVGRWAAVGLAAVGSARPETIHLGSDDVANFCSKSGSEQKTQEWRPLPKRTNCTCKKTQDLMPSASRNHLKV